MSLHFLVKLILTKEQTYLKLNLDRQVFHTCAKSRTTDFQMPFQVKCNRVAFIHLPLKFEKDDLFHSTLDLNPKLIHNLCNHMVWRKRQISVNFLHSHRPYHCLHITSNNHGNTVFLYLKQWTHIATNRTGL